MAHQLNIGIAGTGRMGTAIAGRLLQQGCSVTVWNRTPGKTAALAAAGAKLSATATQLAETCDVVLTILTNAAALDAVWRVSKFKLFLKNTYTTPEGDLHESISGYGIRQFLQAAHFAVAAEGAARSGDH